MPSKYAGSMMIILLFLQHCILPTSLTIFNTSFVFFWSELYNITKRGYNHAAYSEGAGIDTDSVTFFVIALAVRHCRGCEGTKHKYA